MRADPGRYFPRARSAYPAHDGTTGLLPGRSPRSPAGWRACLGSHTPGAAALPRARTDRRGWSTLAERSGAPPLAPRSNARGDSGRGFTLACEPHSDLSPPTSDLRGSSCWSRLGHGAHGDSIGEERKHSVPGESAGIDDAVKPWVAGGVVFLVNPTSQLLRHTTWLTEPPLGRESRLGEQLAEVASCDRTPAPDQGGL